MGGRNEGFCKGKVLGLLKKVCGNVVTTYGKLKIHVVNFGALIDVFPCQAVVVVRVCL